MRLIYYPLLNSFQQPGVPALTVEQPEEGLESLRLRATEREVCDEVVYSPRADV